MKPNDFPRLRLELETRVQARTGRRVKNLNILLSPEGVVLEGNTYTYYDKQLAQTSIRDLLPEVRLQNAIIVA